MNAARPAAPRIGVSRLGASPGDHYGRLERSGLTMRTFMRLAGAHYLVGALTAALMFAVLPPTDAIGDAGWWVAGGGVVLALMAGAYLIRSDSDDPVLHLRMLCFAVVLITTAIWLAGKEAAPFALLYLLAAPHIGVHPPARIAWLTALVTVSTLSALLPAGVDADSAALALYLPPMLTIVIAGVVYRLGAFYGDEALARGEAARVRAEAQFVQREAEQARLAADRLRALDELKDEFVSTVSHELRTPLTSVKGYLEAILAGEAGELTPTQREYAEIVYRNATRLQELVDDLLVLSRVDAGDLVLRRERFDLIEALRRVREEHGPRANENGLMLILDAPREIELTADRRRVEQTIGNLVSNAIKYGGEGEAVRIRAFVDDGNAVVEVADEGVGIPAHELSRIGERFFRATTAGDVQGSGLGLAITREIVHRHGGTLEVDSVEGAGSTFRVSFPRSA
jgi:signal transduction histidine kinase